MQQPKSKPKAWLWISLVFLAFYILLGTTGTLLYRSNDDPAVISITKSGDFHTPYSHSALAWVFMSLYSWKKDFFWYDLFIVTIYSVGICRLFFLFGFYRKLSFPVATLLISCVLLGFLPFQPDFTPLAMLMSIGAIFPFLVGDTEEARCLSWRNVLISSLFLLGACLQRSSAVLLIVGCALGVHVLLAAWETIKKCPQSSVKDFWGRAGILLGMAGFAVSMYLINMVIFTSSAEYGRQIEYDMYRRGFTDFNKYRYNKNFEELGISKNDFHLMTSFMGIDSPPLHLENLRKLPSVPTLNMWRVKKGLEEALHSLKNRFSLILLAVLFFISLSSARARVSSGVCIASIVVIAIFTSRMLLRVCLPILAFGVITSIFFLESERQKKNLKKGGLDYFFLYFLVFILTLIFSVRYQYSRIDRRMKDLKMVEPMWEFCEKRNIESVAHWISATSSGNKFLFTSVQRRESPRKNSIGGWTGSYPQRLRQLRQIYGQDIYAGLAWPGTFHLVQNHLVARILFETFVREHGPENATPRIIFETKHTVLYQIYGQNP